MTHILKTLSFGLALLVIVIGGSSADSLNETALQSAGEKPVSITFVIRLDPLPAPGGSMRKEAYQRERDNLAWLMDYLEQLEREKGRDYVPHMVLELTGDKAEYYRDDPVGLALLKRLQAKGHSLWTGSPLETDGQEAFNFFEALNLFMDADIFTNPRPTLTWPVYVLWDETEEKTINFSGIADNQVAMLGEASEVNRPNFLLIITDDQRHDTMDFMPLAQARIFAEGVRFVNGYVTTPLCCPSRASILTGMYCHKHGVRTNPDKLRKSTFVERLHQVGYFTGLVGKYLNSWDGSARPEFDFWTAFAGGGSRYFNPRLNVNGSWSVHQGYMTYILRDYALRFLEKAAQQDKPFALIFAPNAPHSPFDPAPGDENLYSDLPLHRPPSFNEQDVSDKPRWLQAIKPLNAQQQAQIDDNRRRQLQMLWSLDQAIGAIIDQLEKQGKLDNTVIFYISDNGFFWGEHRLTGKNRVYEEAIRVPFALRYPKLAKGQVEAKLVANIDIAPTIYELAGLPVPADIDGRSLVSLLQGKGEWRDDLLIEGWPSKAPYAAVHTERYIYVETQGDRAELYDLEQDPYQLENRVNDPAYASIVTEMRQRLERLQQGGR